MAINLVGASQNLNDSLNTIVTAFKRTREEAERVRDSATHYPLKAHSGLSVVLATYGILEARSLSDGVDMEQAQDLADTPNTYTPAEVGVQLVIADTTIRRSADPALMRQAGRSGASAYQRKEDGDGVGQFSSFTGGLGSAGTVLSPGHVTAAAAQLRTGTVLPSSTVTAEPAPGDYMGFFTPAQIHAVAMRIIPLSDVPTGTNAYAVTSSGVTVGPGRAGNLSDDLIRSGRKALGMLGGVHMHESANITSDASSDAIGAVFSKEGLIFAPEMEPVEKPQRDESARATELNIVGAYAWGVYRPAAFGLSMTFDSALPTA